jgi:chromosome condensin MukBEF ATPase and DNA-binding subunit MukB
VSRARIGALALVNWRGVFYERYLLDRHVTALEGANGAGKTTVMVAAYVALLPDLSRLRFTNVGESGATGGDRGIWGRLGEAARPAYTVLDLELAGGTRLIAGVRLRRLSEPSVEATPWLIRGLSPEVALSDVLLQRRDDLDHVAELDEIKQAAKRHGGSLEQFRSTKDYFAALFEAGVTPLRLATDEDRNKLNEMLRTSMTGGISRVLTSELRGFLLKAEVGLGDVLGRMRENLEACRRTRAEVAEARVLERDISAVYEAGQAMLSAAYAAAQRTAAEAERAAADARAALAAAERQAAELAAQADALSAREAMLEQEHAAVRAAERNQAARLERARSARQLAERARDLARQTAERQATAELSAAKLTAAAAERESARVARDHLQEAHQRAALGLAQQQEGLDELHRRAYAHRELGRALGELRTLTGRVDLELPAVAELREQLARERESLQAERARRERDRDAAAARSDERRRAEDALAELEKALAGLDAAAPEVGSEPGVGERAARDRRGEGDSKVARPAKFDERAAEAIAPEELTPDVAESIAGAGADCRQSNEALDEHQRHSPAAPESIARAHGPRRGLDELGSTVAGLGQFDALGSEAPLVGLATFAGAQSISRARGEPIGRANAGAANLSCLPGALEPLARARVVLGRLDELGAEVARLGQLILEGAELARIAARQRDCWAVGAGLGLACGAGLDAQAALRELSRDASAAASDAEHALSAARMELEHAAAAIREHGERAAALAARAEQWPALAAAAASAERTLGLTLGDRSRLGVARGQVLEELAELLSRRRQLQADRDEVLRIAGDLAGAGAALDPELIRLRDELGADLLIERFDDSPLENAAALEAALGPLTSALVVDDPLAAARAIAGKPRTAADVWLVRAGADLELEEDAASIGGDVIRVERFGVRVTRAPAQPAIGAGARAARAAAMRERAESLAAAIEGCATRSRQLTAAQHALDVLHEAQASWLAGDPAGEIDHQAAALQPLLAAETAAADRLARARQTCAAARERRDACVRLEADAHLFDGTDHALASSRLQARIEQTRRAQRLLAAVAEARQTLRSLIEAMRSAPADADPAGTARELERLHTELEWRYRAIAAADSALAQRHASGWSDAAERLDAHSEILPMLRAQHDEARAAVARADRAVIDADSAWERAATAAHRDGAEHAAALAAETRACDELQALGGAPDDALLAHVEAEFAAASRRAAELSQVSRQLITELARTRERAERAVQACARARRDVEQASAALEPARQAWKAMQTSAKQLGLDLRAATEPARRAHSATQSNAPHAAVELRTNIEPRRAQPTMHSGPQRDEPLRTTAERTQDARHATTQDRAQHDELQRPTATVPTPDLPHATHEISQHEELDVRTATDSTRHARHTARSSEHELATNVEPERSASALLRDADAHRALLIERLLHSRGGAEAAREIEAAPDVLASWSIARAWLLRRVPAQIATHDDPLRALERLRDDLDLLQERLSRQEHDLRGASEDIARGIDVQLRRAATQVRRLNERIAGVEFGSICAIRVQLRRVDRMEQILKALREGEAQELLFLPSIPVEEALEEIFRRYGGGRGGGQRLLDYREYLELAVEIRRKTSEQWELASPTKLSTGEAIGVGAALMMVVLAEWERDANLLRARATSGSLRFLFLDEANRLSQDNLGVLFELCRTLDLQLLIAAPEVARADGNTTYRLVRHLTDDGREEVIVSGRRAVAAQAVPQPEPSA